MTTYYTYSTETKRLSPLRPPLRVDGMTKEQYDQHQKGKGREEREADSPPQRSEGVFSGTCQQERTQPQKEKDVLMEEQIFPNNA